MYRIMIAKSKKGYESLYQFLTSAIDGVVTPVEFASKAALDTYVEQMLNGSYSKSDFIIVEVMDYVIDAVIDDESEPEEATSDQGQEGD